MTFYATDFAALAQIPILTLSFVLNKLDRVWPGQAIRLKYLCSYIFTLETHN